MPNEPSCRLMAMGKALLAVAAVLGIGWLVTRKPKTKTKPKTTPSEPKAPPKTGPPPAGGKYVGGGWTDWPLKDRFPDQRAFGQSLQLLGYNAGMWNSASWSVLDKQAREAVELFQLDFNLLMEHRRYMEAQGREPEAGLPPVRGDLSEDGLLWPSTIPALADAFTYQEVAGKKWWDIIAGAQAELPVA